MYSNSNNVNKRKPGRPPGSKNKRKRKIVNISRNIEKEVDAYNLESVLRELMPFLQSARISMVQTVNAIHAVEQELKNRVK